MPRAQTEKSGVFFAPLDWVIPKEIKDGPIDSLRQARLLVGLCLPLIVICFLGLIPLLQIGGPTNIIFLINMAAFLSYSYVLFLLRTSKTIRQPGIALCSIMFIGYIGMVAATGGYSSFLLYWCAATILIALLLLGAYWGILYSFLSGLVVTGFFLLEYNGHNALLLPFTDFGAKAATEVLHIAKLFLLLSFLGFVATIGWIFELSRKKAVEELETIHAANQELMFARKAAEASSRAKSDFLTTMSHELRTPLNAIIGYSEILEEEAELAELPAFIEDLGKIQGAGRHLLFLINDLLDLSKIEAGKMEVHLSTFAFADLAHELKQIISPHAAKNGNQLVLACQDDSMAIHSDRIKVKQILLNLLSNAAKFTHKGTIHFTIARTKEHGREWLSCQIKDTGIGIPQEAQSHLFEIFTQVDSSTSRKYEGSGLGLSITKRLCELLHGSVEMESQPGVGSTFTVKLPMQITTEQSNAHQIAQTTQELATIATTKRKRNAQTILIVDDDPAALDLLTRVIVKEGYQVISTSSGREGLRIAKELRPAAIVLDVLMPETSGWELLDALQDSEATKHIPVIMLTALEEKEKSIALGAVHHLTKPLDRTLLLEALQNKGSIRVSTTPTKSA